MIPIRQVETMFVDSELSNHWDQVLSFQEKAHQHSPSGREGLVALRKIQKIIGSSWDPGIAGSHPLKSHFWTAYEENYKWLIHFAMKLDLLVQMPGHEHVLSRFRSPESYPSASDEMDFALKLSLAGFQTKFDFRRGEPSPDLVSQIANQETDIEITSLNQTYEDSVGIDALSSVQMIAMQSRCASGGFWSRVPNPGELEEARTKTQEKVAQAKAQHMKVDLNIPGLLTCYIAPDDLAGDIPAPWRGSFVMRTSSPTRKKDRLARTIVKKAKSQLSRPKQGILVIYDRFSTPDEARGFSNEKELELVVGTFPNLAGVILLCPFNTVLHTVPVSNQRVDKEHRTHLEYSLPDNVSELVTIWRNLVVDHRSVLEPVINALTTFPASLDQLFAALQNTTHR